MKLFFSTKIQWIQVIKIKLKPVLPTLREKKRYLSFKVHSKDKMASNLVKGAIKSSMLKYVGELGTSEAGLMFMDKLYDQKTQIGVIKVANKHVDSLKISLALIDKINKSNVIVRSIKTSGMINRMK